MTSSMRTIGVLIAIVFVACGDPETNDKRGYTKAPLEHPTVVIRGEEPSEMSRYGAPNRVVAEEIALAEDVAPTAQPAQPGAGTQPAVQLPEGVTQEMVTQGTQLFGGAGTCFACHGANGVGTPIGPALNDATWLHIDGSYDAIVQIITTGVSAPKQSAAVMAPRGGSQITDEQVRQIAAYVYSISR